MVNLSVIIPAAGCAKRMKGSGAKALIEINQGETVVQRQIRLVENTFPGALITVVVGYESEKVIDILSSKICVVHNDLYECTNVARSIYLGMVANPADNTLIVYGDLVFNKNLLNEVLDSYWSASPLSTLVVDNGRSRTNEVGCVIHKDGSLLNMDYGLKAKWSQVGYLLKEDRDKFVKLAGKRDSRKLFGYEIFNQMIEENYEIKTIAPKGVKLVEIDRPEDVIVARKVFQ